MNSKDLVKSENSLNSINEHNGLPENKILQILDRLPPEAIFKIVETTGDILKANKVLEGKELEFRHQITLMRENNSDKKELLSFLKNLLTNPNIPQESLSNIVTSICNIAEGKHEK